MEVLISEFPIDALDTGSEPNGPDKLFSYLGGCQVASPQLKMFLEPNGHECLFPSKPGRNSSPIQEIVKW